jgi:hypothetical protein
MNIDHEMNAGDSDPNTLKDAAERHNARSGHRTRHSSVSAKQECNGPATGHFVMTDAPTCHWLASAKRFAVIIESRQCLAAERVQPFSRRCRLA